MISTVIAPGTKLDMVRLKNSFGEEVEERQFNSKIVDIVEEELIKIAMPIENNIIIPLEVGENYHFIFYTGNGLYQCKGEIIERFKEGLISICLVQLQTDLEKYQRRQYYRLECVMDTKYRIVSREEKYCQKKLEEQLYQTEEEKEKLKVLITQLQAQWELATIIDISGGGCRFNSTSQIIENESIEVRITYNSQGKEQEYKYKGTVISSEPVEKRAGYFEHRIEFADIDIFERENLIKFIFEEERKIRRRERGLS